MAAIKDVYEKLQKKSSVLNSIVLLRYALGFSFIPSGVTKILGNRFTILPASDPVGQFFDVLYQAGIYWNFLGYIQILASLMLMTQRFACIGNFLFFGMCMNMLVISLSLDTQGTLYANLLMLVGSLILLSWDLPKWIPLLYPEQHEKTSSSSERSNNSSLWIITGFLLFIESVSCAWLLISSNWMLSWVSAFAIFATLLVALVANQLRQKANQ